MSTHIPDQPYFLWDYDLTNDQIKAILKGDNEVEKIWLMSRILESARYEDIWHYLTLKQVKEMFPLLRLKPSIRQVWEYALQVWEAADNIHE
jgi:uncharacterized protein (DUF433 family)